jgi:osmoprotectant transport system permease protein
VTTIGLISVSALIGQGGLGALMTSGFEKDFYTPLVVGVVLTVAFAIGADALLLGAQKLCTPWARRSVAR